MTAADLFRFASQAVLGRRDVHGEPGTALVRIAKLWSLILEREVEPHEVALCMAALKLARLIERPTHADSWVDLAGYAACGVETVEAK